MSALISIDHTHDFVAEDGKLTTRTAGRVIEKKLAVHIKKFIDQKDPVVSAIDAHDSEDSFHPENRLFPSHNVIGTGRQELYGSLESLYQDYEQEGSVYWIDKRHYSAFSRTDLDICLREHQITNIYLTGVYTDTYALHTAVDTYNFGYKLRTFKDAVASLDPVGHKWALKYFESILGAEVL